MLELSDPGTCVHVCAPTYVRMSSEIQRNDRTYVPRETSVALHPNTKRLMTPVYDLYELQSVLDYYAYCGITSLVPAWEGVLRIG